jgi:hypothetical protein
VTKYVEPISHFADLNYVNGIMLTGSYAEHCAMDSSDIDVILVQWVWCGIVDIT